MWAFLVQIEELASGVAPWQDRVVVFHYGLNEVVFFIAIFICEDKISTSRDNFFVRDRNLNASNEETGMLSLTGISV